MLSTEFVTAFTFHQQRQREVERRRTTLEMLRSADEQPATQAQADLLREIRQWMQARARTQQQEVSDVRRAHAI